MSSSPLIFEIGTEEIPAFALVDATRQLGDLAAEALDDARIRHGEIRTYSTPRRIVLELADLALESDTLMSRMRGPSADIAFDADGNPTKAAMGFARGHNVEVRDLVRSMDGDREYVYAIVTERAHDTARLLPDLLAGLITRISWPRSMRWGSRDERFSRPVRWLMCLWGDKVIPVRYAGLTAGNRTRGHRLLANEEFEVPSSAEYRPVLARAWVIPQASRRIEIIREQIAEHERETGYVADVPEHTFVEVVNLVEYPTVLLGHFEEKYLEVPTEIITDAMLEHQRYFPMYTKEGKLTNAFLIVSNGARSCSEAIIDGNERVVRPRLADASFFYYEDKKTPLEGYVGKLGRLTFQEKLGTVLDKTRRIESLVSALCLLASADEADTADASRAAHLCKADLVTSAVIEFTSLQGVMGGYYARESGEGEAVATAITEHYRPRFSGDELPSSFAGKIVAFCDKLDTICGIFAIGQGPTGSKDPFAVRRSAIGCIQILLNGNLKVGLDKAIALAVGGFKGAIEYDPAKTMETVRDFFTTRCAVMARERGAEADTVDAVLASGIIEPAEVFARCEALDRARSQSPETFENLSTAYTRAANLADPALGTECDGTLFSDDDRALFEAVTAAERDVSDALAAGDYEAAISACALLRNPIDTFFESVLVMDEDIDIRENRLRLLNRFVGVFADVADIGKLKTR